MIVLYTGYVYSRHNFFLFSKKANPNILDDETNAPSLKHEATMTVISGVERLSRRLRREADRRFLFVCSGGPGGPGEANGRGAEGSESQRDKKRGLPFP